MDINTLDLEHTHRYVTVCHPLERKGHRYYGCSLRTCKADHTVNSIVYYPVHCFICNSDMLLDDARKDLILDQKEARLALELDPDSYHSNANVFKKIEPGFAYIEDRLVVCTNCHKTYKKRINTMVNKSVN